VLDALLPCSLCVDIVVIALYGLSSETNEKIECSHCMECVASRRVAASGVNELLIRQHVSYH